MARNFSFLKNKRLWIPLTIGVLLLLFAVFAEIFFFSSLPLDTDSFSQRANLREATGDFFAPTSIIEEPEARTWQNRAFSVAVFEEDLETGLDLSSCAYETCAYSTGGEEFCSGPIARTCNSKTPFITVGNNSMMCRFEGRNACEVFVEARDAAGNTGSFSQAYHIDFTPPQVGRVVLGPDFVQREGAITLEQEKEYGLQVVVQDNVELRGCWLYGNGVYLKPTTLNADCLHDCIASATFQMEGESSLNLAAFCTDVAGNLGQGEAVEVKVNQQPVVSSCRVSPAQGTRDTEFQFLATAVDPDTDPLLYLWEFGDGNVQEGQEVLHRYPAKGTYMPKVTVHDKDGLFGECGTAWAVVEE